MSEKSTGPSGDPQSDWYYVDAGDVQGPVDWWSLLRLLVTGEIPRDSRVWRPGMDDWARASLVSEIASCLPPEVPESHRPTYELVEEPSRVVSKLQSDYEGPQSHPDPPTEESGRGVVVMFVIAIIVVVGAFMSLQNERPSEGAASVAGSYDESLLDGTLAGFPERKRTIVRGYVDRFRRALQNNLTAARLDTLGSFEEGYRAGKHWTQHGRRRLSDAQLSRMLVLESKVLHGVDKRLCGRILQGTADWTEEWRALMALDTRDLRELLDLRSRAFQAELEATPARRPMPSDDVLWSAITATLNAMPQARADSLERAFSADSIPPAQECWGTRSMYRYVPELQEPHRSVMTRYLLWLGTETNLS